LLLDTNALIWFYLGSNRIGSKALRRIENAPAIYFSPISILEIEIKRMKSKMPVEPDFYTDLVKSNFIELKLSGLHAMGISKYQDLVNHDPFDRILLAAAESEGLPFMTADSKLLATKLSFVMDATE
jgi:PIN domain nuclease of toxin-antitoxin system